MPFDTSIFQMVGHNVPPVDVAGSMGKGLQLRDMIQARNDDQTMRDLSIASGGNMGQLADLAQGKGLYRQAQDLRVKELARQKEVAQIQETMGKVDAQKRAAVEAGNADLVKMAVWADSPEKWAQGMQIVARDHPIMAQGMQPYLQFSPDTRMAVITRGQTVKEAIDGLKPKIEERNGAMVPVTTNVLGQQTVGAPVGFKAQTDPAKAIQDLNNGLIDERSARDYIKKTTTHGTGVTINTGEKLPPGWRQDPDNPGAWKPIPGGPHDPKSGDKPLTDSQGNALGFGIRAREADAIMSELEAKGVNPGTLTNRIASAVPVLGNYAKSPEIQAVEQAQRNFVTAVLRKESGAAISIPEFETEAKKYFPQPGDSEAVRKQKADARKTAVAVLQIQSGREIPEVVKPVKAAKPGQPAKPVGSDHPAAAQMQEGTISASGNYVWRNGGWVKR